MEGFAIMNKDLIRKLFEYNPLTGNLIDRKGKIRGTIRKNGMSGIRIKTKLYYTHRLIWLWLYGYWPKNIDHINGNCSDNRFNTLEEAIEISKQVHFNEGYHKNHGRN
jgi:hypothetical protein